VKFLGYFTDFVKLVDRAVDDRGLSSGRLRLRQDSLAPSRTLGNPVNQSAHDGALQSGGAGVCGSGLECGRSGRGQRSQAGDQGVRR